MSAASISHAIQSIGFLSDFRESQYVYPIAMAIHLSSIALFGGLILLTDLRLLGFALTDIPVTDLVRGTRIWKRIGFVIMVTMGLLLATCKMDKYYNNPYFLLKMFLLADGGRTCADLPPQGLQPYGGDRPGPGDTPRGENRRHRLVGYLDRDRLLRPLDRLFRASQNRVGGIPLNGLHVNQHQVSALPAHRRRYRLSWLQVL